MKRRMAVLLLVALAGPVPAEERAARPAPVTAPGPAAPVSAPGPSVQLVPQTVGLGAFDAAGWLPDGRYLLTVSGHERLVRIWDTGGDAPWKPIVDTIGLPWFGVRADEKLVLERVVVAPDGKRARVEAVMVAENPAMGPVTYAPVDFALDLVNRTAHFQQTNRNPDDPAERIPGLGEVPDIDAGLPVLPMAPDGRRLQRNTGRLNILDADGQTVALLGQHLPPDMRWVSMSHDGAKVAFLSNEYPAGMALKLFDVASGRFQKAVGVPAGLGRVDWLSQDLLMASPRSSAGGRDARFWPDRAGPPDAAVLVRPSDGSVRGSIEGRCFVQPLGSGRLVGAGAAACRHGVPDAATLWTAGLDGAAGWARLPLEVPAGTTIDAVQASADGGQVAVALGREGRARAVMLLDAATGAVLAQLPRSGAPVTGLAFGPDRQALVVVSSSEAVLWEPWEGNRNRRLPATDSAPSMIVTDGSALLLGGEMSPMVQRIDLAAGRVQPPLAIVAPLSGGFLRDRPILWIGSAGGSLRLYDSRDFRQVAEMQQFHDGENDYFLLRDSDNRYDSNLQPDRAPFRWLVMDKPFQSLATQTFMRDLYTPDLLARLMECMPERRCAAVLPPVPDLTGLNRTLPVIAAVAATSGSAPGLVDVTVTVKNGENASPTDSYGHSRSGMHNLKLFRGGVLVRQTGAPPPQLDRGDREGWRTATRLPPNRPDGAHVATFRDIRMPTLDDGTLLFSAYAFNEDRVRGEENNALAPESAVPPRRRRLFLMSVGVDAYPGGLFRPLRYAVADARAMHALFSETMVHPAEAGGMEVVTIRVEGTADAPATKARIAAAALQLGDATPDDLIVLSFSGHGYTDAQGRFALVPSDVRTVGDRPVMASMISADELAAWLMRADAGGMFVVIDACHSAASVMAGGFKPGPMGDPGLGQLAYDKGVRILSASAPDQYAMEDSALGHGLLTYAMLEGAGGSGDGDADGLVTLDELMAYAVRRLPELGSLAMLDADEGPGLVVEWSGPPVPRQTPRLFDFSQSWTQLALRVPERP